MCFKLYGQVAYKDLHSQSRTTVLKSFPTMLYSAQGFCHKDHNLWVTAITGNNGDGPGQFFSNSDSNKHRCSSQSPLPNLPPGYISPASHAVWGRGQGGPASEARPELDAGKQAAAADIPCNLSHQLDDTFTVVCNMPRFFMSSYKCSVS